MRSLLRHHAHAFSWTRAFRSQRIAAAHKWHGGFHGGEGVHGTGGGGFHGGGGGFPGGGGVAAQLGSPSSGLNTRTETRAERRGCGVIMVAAVVEAITEAETFAKQKAG